MALSSAPSLFDDHPLLMGNFYRLRTPSAGHYGRPVMDFRADNRSLTCELVRVGHVADRYGRPKLPNLRSCSEP